MTDFQTPEWCCRLMVSMVPDWCGSILEPTPGEGNLVRELLQRGKYNVTAPSEFWDLSDEIVFSRVIHLPRKTFKGARVQCCIIYLDRGYSGSTDLAFASAP